MTQYYWSSVVQYNREFSSIRFKLWLLTTFLLLLFLNCLIHSTHFNSYFFNFYKLEELKKKNLSQSTYNKYFTLYFINIMIGNHIVTNACVSRVFSPMVHKIFKNTFRLKIKEKKGREGRRFESLSIINKGHKLNIVSCIFLVTCLTRVLELYHKNIFYHIL